MRLFLNIAVTMAAVAMAAWAPNTGSLTKPDGQQADARVCFRTMNMRGFSADGDKTLYVRTAAREVLQFDTLGGCRGLDTAIAIDLRSQDGFRQLCTGDFSTLNIMRPTDTACRVQVVKQLSEAEVAALPSRTRP